MAISQPRNRTRSGSRASAPLRPPPGEMDLLLGVRKTGMTPEARRSLCPRQARPGCSTRAFAAPDRRVIESQSVRLSANFLRPERRSTDGQVILKRTSGRSENRPDLLFCGAPLRNRTVDLLLTIENPLGSLACGAPSGVSGSDRHASGRGLRQSKKRGRPAGCGPWRVSLSQRPQSRAPGMLFRLGP
jgi:hypothetical protein